MWLMFIILRGNNFFFTNNSINKDIKYVIDKEWWE